MDKLEKQIEEALQSHEIITVQLGLHMGKARFKEAWDNVLQRQPPRKSAELISVEERDNYDK